MRLEPEEPVLRVVALHRPQHGVLEPTALLQLVGVDHPALEARRVGPLDQRKLLLVQRPKARPLRVPQLVLLEEPQLLAALLEVRPPRWQLFELRPLWHPDAECHPPPVALPEQPPRPLPRPLPARLWQ